MEITFGRGGKGGQPGVNGGRGEDGEPARIDGVPGYCEQFGGVLRWRPANPQDGVLRAGVSGQGGGGSGPGTSGVAQSIACDTDRTVYTLRLT